MRYLTFSLLLLLTACASSERIPASGEPKEKKPDYLSWLGTKYFDGPNKIAPPASDRAAKIFLPKDYSEKTNWPLIIQLHGYTSSADEANFYLGLGSRVTAKGFVLLTPEGKTNSQGDQFWNATDFCCDFEKSGVDDVAYILSLVEVAAKEYKIDRDRIYLYGHSNGGYMGNRLLCETSNVFAGLVNLAGSTFKDPSLCRIQKPVSYLHIHASDDPTVKFGENSEHAGGKNTAEQRAKAAGCANEPKKGPRRDQVFLIPFKDTTPYVWQGCQGGTEVVLWEIEPSKIAKHKAHAPAFWWPAHVDQTIDFLFRHRRQGSSEKAP